MCVFLALVIQHIKRMRCVILSSVASPALQYFSTLSHKRHDFGGGGGGEIIEYKMCCDLLYNYSLKHFAI
jgi:hypothetical protein